MKEKKEYLPSDDQLEQNVSEPAAIYYKTIKEPITPCCFTQEELENELRLAEKDIQEGNVYTTEELRKIHPLC